MIAIVDYGAGNLQSVHKALNYIGVKSQISSDGNFILSANGVILPGVGSFEDAMNCMKKSGLLESVKKAALSGKPFLGICLGLQLLFEHSEESPGAAGLGILKGKIRKIPACEVKVPHMGWNSLDIKKNEGIFKGIKQGTYVYFVHSYYLEAENKGEVAATAYYGVEIDAAVSKGALFGCQFHPEKSGEAGLIMLRNFAAICGGEDCKNVC
ncbi:MAG: imidazole glycerol phosphate synthase subunit HisH [Clostridiales bacterium]|jgi:glutamine amidotransferase|nr:imidazole glycerol phosphate synthase subunit HisH [Clostridiales bacterium]